VTLSATNTGYFTTIRVGALLGSYNPRTTAVTMCGSSLLRVHTQLSGPPACSWTILCTSVMAATKMLRVSERIHDGFRREAKRRGATIDEAAWLDAPLR
jgi:hypothetical protein